MGLGEPSFAVVALEANAGWRVDEHPRFVTDLSGDRCADIIGFGDDGVRIGRSHGDGRFPPTALVLQELGSNQCWRVDSHLRSELSVSPARTNNIRADGYGRWARSW